MHCFRIMCVNMKLFCKLKRNVYMILLFKEMGIVRKSSELTLELFLQLPIRKTIEND